MNARLKASIKEVVGGSVPMPLVQELGDGGVSILMPVEVGMNPGFPRDILFVMVTLNKDGFEVGREKSMRYLPEKKPPAFLPLKDFLDWLK